MRLRDRAVGACAVVILLLFGAQVGGNVLNARNGQLGTGTPIPGICVLIEKWRAIKVAGNILVGDSPEYHYGLRTVPIDNIGGVQVGSLATVGIDQRNSCNGSICSGVNHSCKLVRIERLKFETLNVLTEQNVIMNNRLHSRAFPNVFEVDINYQRLAYFELLNLFRLAINATHNVEGHYGYVGALIQSKLFFNSYQSVVSGPSLPSGQTSVYEQQGSRGFRPKEYLAAVGCAISLSGLILLFKVLDKVYLYPRFNVNMAFCGFWIAALMFWFGGWIVFHILGLLS